VERASSESYSARKIRTSTASGASPRIAVPAGRTVCALVSIVSLAASQRQNRERGARGNTSEPSILVPHGERL